MKRLLAINLLLLIGLTLFAKQVPVEYKQIEDLLVSIRMNGGDVFYAEEFYRWKEEYEKIRESSPTVLSIEDRQKIQKIYEKLQEIEKNSGKIRPYLSSVLAAREAALTNGADDFAQDYFQKAENELHRLAEKLKHSRPQRYQEKIDALERLYREAQFEAIRNKLLSEVRIFLQEAKNLGAEKYAPTTYKLVTDLFHQVETILKKKRFNDASLQAKAQKLQQESQHLLYLTQKASEIYRTKSAFETYQLRLEQTINQLCQAIEYIPDYSAGVPAVLSDVTTGVQSLKHSLETEREKNRVLRDSVERLNQRIQELQEKLGKHQEFLSQLSALKQRLLKIGVITAQKGNQILLTLNGLNFAPGGVTLPEEEQTTLSRIAREIQKLPYQKIEVRIIQAAAGNREYNQTLANQRAKSVTLFLQSHAFIPDDQLSYKGIIIENSQGSRGAILQLGVYFNPEE